MPLIDKVLAFSQNLFKNASFWFKNCKNRPAWGIHL